GSRGSGAGLRAETGQCPGAGHGDRRADDSSRGRALCRHWICDMTDLRVRYDPESFEAAARERGPIRAPRGTGISCKGWQQEAALRMLMNNLDPEVAERPQDLVVYGGTGKAARNWDCFDAIARELRDP